MNIAQVRNHYLIECRDAKLFTQSYCYGCQSVGESYKYGHCKQRIAALCFNQLCWEQCIINFTSSNESNSVKHSIAKVNIFTAVLFLNKLSDGSERTFF